MQYQYYSLACHEGTSTQEVVLTVLAISLRDAVEAVLKWGYTLAAPPGYELVRIGK